MVTISTARLALLSDLPIATKPDSGLIRVVGRVAGKDIVNGALLIVDGEFGLVVYVGRLVGGTKGSPYMPKIKDLVMITGELGLIDGLIMPPMEAPHSAPSVPSDQVLQAVFIKPVEELDMEAWRAGVMATLQEGRTPGSESQ